MRGLEWEMERAKVMVPESQLRKWAGLAGSSQAADWRERLWGSSRADFFRGL